MSYGTDVADMFRQVEAQTGQILKGAKPAELPVLQSTKFEFVINLQTARALGIEVPNSIQLLADEVIDQQRLICCTSSGQQLALFDRLRRCALVSGFGRSSDMRRVAAPGVLDANDPERS
jgi:hypothetical protein